SIAVLDDGETTGNFIAKKFFQRESHSRRRLTGADNVKVMRFGEGVGAVADSETIAGNMNEVFDRSRRLDTLKAGLEDLARMAAQFAY
ncbi:MAG TPA: hypothetical protein VLA17_08090, partial [Candidatus Limnocylindria bacterium]|nr:hypothetical protein [Candidatus Limnocylindria bacterium]